MFAFVCFLAALLCFVVALFTATLGPISLVTLGLLFMALGWVVAHAPVRH